MAAGVDMRMDQTHACRAPKIVCYYKTGLDAVSCHEQKKKEKINAKIKLNTNHDASLTKHSV